jgi:hypothetical protein
MAALRWIRAMQCTSTLLPAPMTGSAAWKTRWKTKSGSRMLIDRQFSGLRESPQNSQPHSHEIGISTRENSQRCFQLHNAAGYFHNGSIAAVSSHDFRPILCCLAGKPLRISAFWGK